MRDSFITLTRQLTSIVIGMLLVIVVARVLGSSGQGHYTTITILPTLLMTFLNLGINISTIYYVSKKEISLNSAVLNNTILGVLLGVLGIIIGFIIIHLFKGTYNGINPAFLYLCLLGLPFMILNIFYQTIYQGLQDFKTFNMVLVVTQTSTVIYVLIAFFVFHLGLLGAILSFALGHVTTFTFNVFMFKKKYGVRLKGVPFSWSYFKKSINYGGKAYLSNVMAVLNYRTAILMLIFFLGSSVVGFYSVAVTLAERFSIFSQSISSVLLPKIASSENANQRNQLTSLVSRNVLIFMVIGTIIALLVMHPVMTLLFGVKYKNSIVLLEILLPGIAFLSVEKILSNDIAGRGRPDLNMYVSIFNILLNVSLNLYFIPRFGAQGAAIATTITYLVSFVIKAVIYRKYTGEPYWNFLIIKGRDLLLYKKLFSRIQMKLRLKQSS